MRARGVSLRVLPLVSPCELLAARSMARSIHERAKLHRPRAGALASPCRRKNKTKKTTKVEPQMKMETNIETEKPEITRFVKGTVALWDATTRACTPCPLA